MSQMGSSVDWQGWLQRWDDQQAGYLPDREQQFALMLDIVERLIGEPGHFVDLACGPGSIAARAATRFPTAEIVGVDLDPFLLEIARQAVASQHAGTATQPQHAQDVPETQDVQVAQEAPRRVRFAEANLRMQGWDAVLGDEPVDAICSATALHWLDPTDLASLAQTLGRRIRPGGVFINADTMRLGPDEVPRLDALAVALRDEIWADSHASGVEDWKSWWDSAAAEPAFADLLQLREERFANRWRGREITITDTLESFRKAGFTEVGVLGQVADKRRPRRTWRTLCTGPSRRPRTPSRDGGQAISCPRSRLHVRGFPTPIDPPTQTAGERGPDPGETPETTRRRPADIAGRQPCVHSTGSTQ